MTQKGQHVAPSGNRWSVRRTGAERATRIYATEEEAIEKARSIARAEGAVVYIHSRDGRIRERSSFRSDPYPPKG